MPTRTAALLLLAVTLAAAAPLRADEADLPGGPPQREGSFAVGPEVGFVIPLSTNRLCPAPYQCIADFGGAIGLGFTYRWKNGLGLGFSYELWLLTGNGVYETTVPQSFLAVVLYSFLPNRRTHPLIRLRGGFLMLGPSFRVATLGGTAELAFGAEVELTSDSVFSFMVSGNLVRTRSFETPADGALRAVSGPLDAFLGLRIGFNFML